MNVTRDETREQQLISRQKRFEYGQKRKESQNERDISTIKRKSYDDDMHAQHTNHGNQHNLGQVQLGCMENAMTMEQVEKQLHSQPQPPMLSPNPTQSAQNEIMDTNMQPPKTAAKNYFITANLQITPLSSRNGQ